jgi:hypothetical protein
MVFDEAMRFRLHEKLQEAFGRDEADALMAALPPFSWHELATKADLAATEERLRLASHADLADLRSDLVTALAAQTRQVVFSMFAAMTAVGGLALALGRIGH